MKNPAPYPKLYEEIFGTGYVPDLGMRVISHGEFAAAHLTYEHPNLGRSQTYTPETSFLVQLQLRDFVLARQWCNGRVISTDPYAENTVTIYDMRDEWRMQMDDPFDVFHCMVTQDSLDRLADAHGARRIKSLRSPPASGRQDSVMRQLARLLLPALHSGLPNETLLVGHLLLAMHEYIAMQYGGLDPSAKPLKGALPPWQLKRATEFMLAHLAQSISLEHVAAHCSLSINHFVRAFRQTTGKTPHQWLIQQRLDAAMQLLRTGHVSLSQAARACGFADQSHLTRVFSARVGVTPGVWLRMCSVRLNGNQDPEGT
ncbi:AraC family transcriptional regulator [Cupriavidus sp. 30B13]|uniref:AraC family transcriptional regulator n=1 Tax=Cupriavidus sp. 30B13 TaxID=3384241 RepID=UPI003B8F398E